MPHSIGVGDMSDRRVGQEGANQSTGGTGGLYNLRDSDMGGADGDAVINVSGNLVRDIDFQHQRNLQGAGTTFFYPYGRSQQQGY